MRMAVECFVLTLVDRNVLHQSRDNSPGLGLSDVNLLDVKRISLRVKLNCTAKSTNVVSKHHERPNSL